MVTEGIVLGHKISGDGIEVDPAKVEAIESRPYPKDIKGIRSFLGHAGFYRRFMITHKYRGSQQSSREVKPKFIDSTQGEPKNIYKP